MKLNLENRMKTPTADEKPDGQPESDKTLAHADVKLTDDFYPSDEASCSRLFRVHVTFETVIYAEDEKAAKRKVKYGTGEIDDMPVSVIAMPIESTDGLPDGWNAECLPWGDAPLPSRTIGEILNSNAKCCHRQRTGTTMSEIEKLVPEPLTGSRQDP